jgi:hypothetical protein
MDFSANTANTPYLKKLNQQTIFLIKRTLLETTQTEMDPPQTKKQGQKGSKEKRNGFKGLHSGKGVRAGTENQSRNSGKKNKK